jgi:hypothetical protein
METKSSLLLALAIVGSALAIGITYNQIFVRGDFEFEIAISCDPSTESCFVLATECTDGEECTDEPTYQKIMRVRASHLPDECLADTSGCEHLSCIPGDATCSYIFCESTDGESFSEVLGTCSTPEDGVSEEENMVKYEL